MVSRGAKYKVLQVKVPEENGPWKSHMYHPILSSSSLRRQHVSSYKVLHRYR